MSKKVFSLTVVFLLLNISSLFSETTQKSLIFDLGKIRKDTILTRDVHIESAMTTPFVITKVRSSCECITLDLVKKTAVPGESVVIKYNFYASKVDEKDFCMYIYVHSNDPKRPIFRITLTGTVVGAGGKNQRASKSHGSKGEGK